MAQARGLLSVYQSRGTLVPRTCARAVVAPCGKACQGSAKGLHGSFWGRAKTKHSRTKYARQKIKTPGKRSLPGQGGKAPARGACRDDRAKASRPRQEEFAGKAVPGLRLPH